MNKLDETNANSTETTTAQRGEKLAAYSSPRLVAYGCVSALTRAGVGSKVENIGKGIPANTAKRP